MPYNSPELSKYLFCHNGMPDTFASSFTAVFLAALGISVAIRIWLRQPAVATSAPVAIAYR